MQSYLFCCQYISCQYICEEAEKDNNFGGGEEERHIDGTEVVGLHDDSYLTPANRIYN